jgi:hypothetical protein
MLRNTCLFFAFRSCLSTLGRDRIFLKPAPTPCPLPSAFRGDTRVFFKILGPVPSHHNSDHRCSVPSDVACPVPPHTFLLSDVDDQIYWSQMIAVQNLVELLDLPQDLLSPQVMEQFPLVLLPSDVACRAFPTPVPHAIPIPSNTCAFRCCVLRAFPFRCCVPRAFQHFYVDQNWSQMSAVQNLLVELLDLPQDLLLPSDVACRAFPTPVPHAIPIPSNTSAFRCCGPLPYLPI